LKGSKALAAGSQGPIVDFNPDESSFARATHRTTDRGVELQLFDRIEQRDRLERYAARAAGQSRSSVTRPRSIILSWPVTNKEEDALRLQLTSKIPDR